MDRTISRVRPSRDSPGDARPDTAIIAAVADQIRPGIVDSEADPSALFAELAALTAGTPVDCTHVSYERLDQVGPIRWPRSTADFDRADRPGATAIGSEDEKSQSRDRYRYCDSDGEFSFPTADGRARFSTAHHRSVPEPPDERYPLVLTTARKSDAYNTGVRSGEGDDPLPLRVSPATQEAFVSSFDGCDRTVLVSRRGRVLARVDDDDRIPEGVVWAPIHHPDTNLLTLDAVDPESGEPAYKSCAVRFEPP